MLRKPVLAVATALAVAVPLAGTTPTATGAPAPRASNVDLVDEAGDVWVWSEGTSSWELWGSKADADVLGASITHGKKNLRVLMTFDNLRKKRAARYQVRIKTKDMTRGAWVYADAPTGWGGKHELTKGGDKIASPGFEHDIDYADDTVLFTLPRDLFDDPAWVKVMLRNDMVGAHRWTENPHGNGAVPVFTGKIHTP